MIDLTKDDLEKLRARISEKPGVCEGGTCRPEWNWRTPECPMHWPWAVVPSLIALVDHLQSELDEARRTGVVSSGGKSEARRERRMAEVERDAAKEAAANAIEATKTVTRAHDHIKGVKGVAAIVKILMASSDLEDYVRDAFRDLMTKIEKGP